MAKNTNEDEFGHYHDQKKEATSTSKIGNEWVTIKNTYCSKCDKWMKSKVIKRVKIPKV